MRRAMSVMSWLPLQPWAAWLRFARERREHSTKVLNYKPLGAREHDTRRAAGLDNLTGWSEGAALAVNAERHDGVTGLVRDVKEAARLATAQNSAAASPVSIPRLREQAPRSRRPP